MTTEVLAQALVAGQQATFGPGRVWYLKTATAPVSITLEKSGSGATVRKFSNVSAGFKFTALKGDGWTYLRLLSATSQNIEIVVGDDDVVLSNAVSISGVAITQDLPSGGLTDHPTVALPTAAQTNLIGANTARRRVTIGALSTNVGSFFIRAAGGANNLLELPPGTFAELRTGASIDARNDSGNALVATVLEET